MPVHIENNVLARRKRGFNGLRRCAVEVAKHLRPLKKITAVSQLLEFGARNKMVVDAVTFLWAGVGAL